MAFEHLSLLEAVRQLRMAHLHEAARQSFEGWLDENLRFRQSVSRAFTEAEVASVERPDGGTVEVTAQWMGLYDVGGPLPDELRNAAAFYGKSFRDFLDIFNDVVIRWHLIAILPYYPVIDNQIGSDWVTSYVLHVAGIDTPLPETNFEKEVWVYRSYAFAGHDRSWAALELILSDYFSTSVRVRRAGTKGVQGRRRVAKLQIGPLHYKQFMHFHPVKGDAYERLWELCYVFKRGLYEFECEFLVEPATIPLRLRTESSIESGWNDWSVPTGETSRGVLRVCVPAKYYRMKTKRRRFSS